MCGKQTLEVVNIYIFQSHFKWVKKRKQFSTKQDKSSWKELAEA